jgi:hypothetical protein
MCQHPLVNTIASQSVAPFHKLKNPGLGRHKIMPSEVEIQHVFHLATDFLRKLALQESMLDIFFPSTENTCITDQDMAALQVSASR